MSDRKSTATISLDTSRFIAAARAFSVSMKDLAAAALTASRGMAKLAHSLARSNAMRHGLHNMAADGTWQTDMCAAWVHPSCPAPSLCDCTCHGGTVR